MAAKEESLAVSYGSNSERGQEMIQVSSSIESPKASEDFERGFRFWAIIVGLATSSLLASLEHTVVTTAAPHILQDLDLEENFIWITNAFFVCR
jgi:hypothetical protein